ncbi:DUF4326 domain-containing protein [Acrocarpospora sp. B8E8]|uniref:DUF4326 domain-containing protein n=1 Tax=Acrocarpospora sp. B8E8 TaxID=3153572 RepID=UPI00325E4000
MTHIPRRVQVQGDLFHGRVPEGAVYIGRSAPGLPASPYRNPYQVKGRGREEAIRLYSRHLEANPELLDRARIELAGKDVACWCKPHEQCHGDVLLVYVHRAGLAEDMTGEEAPR